MRSWQHHEGGQAHFFTRQAWPSKRTYIFTLPFIPHLLLDRGQQCPSGLLRRLLLLPSFPPSIGCSSCLPSAICEKATTTASTEPHDARLALPLRSARFVCCVCGVVGMGGEGV
jgi:hypothetical protein